jgi:hypothetical protein
MSSPVKTICFIRFSIIFELNVHELEVFYIVLVKLFSSSEFLLISLLCLFCFDFIVSKWYVLIFIISRSVLTKLSM